MMLSSLCYIGYKAYQRYNLSHFNGQIKSEEFFPYNIPNTPSVDDVLRARRSINGFYGLLASEDSDINVPVWRGLSDYALYRGAALEEQNMEFGKGHVIVFGHNVADQYLFGNLPRVRMESKVYMYQGSKIFVYEVYEARSGWDTETAYVEKGIEGHETCTLVTCIGVYPTSARYFVKGKLVGVIDNLDSQKDIKDKYNWK